LYQFHAFRHVRFAISCTEMHLNNYNEFGERKYNIELQTRH